MAGFNPELPQNPQAPEETQEVEQDETTAEIMNALVAVTNQVGTLGSMVTALQESINAPAEIIRDESNRPIAVRKGGKIQKIVRDENGKAIGTVPMPNR